MKPIIPTNIQEKIDSINDRFSFKILSNENDSWYNLWNTDDFLEVKRYFFSTKPYKTMFFSWNKWEQTLSYWKYQILPFWYLIWFNDHVDSRWMPLSSLNSDEGIKLLASIKELDTIVQDIIPEDQTNIYLNNIQIINFKESITRLHTVNDSLISLLIISLASKKKIPINKYWNALISIRSLRIIQYSWFIDILFPLNNFITVFNTDSTHRFIALTLWNQNIDKKVILFDKFEMIDIKNIEQITCVSPSP